uniref:Uncharacterized protein n=1 Tax=Panagrolaimus sp. ES5 TaxID=591445 RepID=A0AC34GXA0_9BILA
MEERQNIRQKLEKQSIKLKEVEDKLVQVWKTHDELRCSGSNLPRSAKVIETFYSLANTTNIIKEKIETIKLGKDHPIAENPSLKLSEQKTLSSLLKSKKIERQAKECVLNYFQKSTI